MHRIVNMKSGIPLALIGICACTALNLQVNTDGLVPMGNPNAHKTVVIFSDFQCSFCKRTAREMERLQVSHPNRFKVYFKHYPLTYHPFAHAAACAAEAARRQGQFWPMHDALFASAAELSDEGISSIAKKLGLEMARFEQDRKSREVAAVIEADKKEGERVGVDGTPYILINGVPFRGTHDELKRELLKR